MHRSLRASMLYPAEYPSCCNSAASVCLPLPEARAPTKRRGTDSSSSGRSGGSTTESSNNENPTPPMSSYPSPRGRLSLAVPASAVVLALTLAGPLGVRAEDDSVPTEEEGDSTSVLSTAINLIVVVVLVAASGLFSGLTLGLLGLDKIGLEIISHGDEPRMASFAKVGLNVTRIFLGPSTAVCCRVVGVMRSAWTSGQCGTTCCILYLQAYLFYRMKSFHRDTLF